MRLFIPVAVWFIVMLFIPVAVWFIVMLFIPVAVWFIVMLFIVMYGTKFLTYVRHSFFFWSDCQLRPARHFDWKLLRVWKQLLNLKPELRLEKGDICKRKKNYCVRKLGFLKAY
jgi:hypothetical protein